MGGKSCFLDELMEYHTHCVNAKTRRLKLSVFERCHMEMPHSHPWLKIALLKHGYYQTPNEDAVCPCPRFKDARSTPVMTRDYVEKCMRLLREESCPLFSRLKAASARTRVFGVGKWDISLAAPLVETKKKNRMPTLSRTYVGVW